MKTKLKKIFATLVVVTMVMLYWCEAGQVTVKAASNGTVARIYLISCMGDTNSWAINSYHGHAFIAIRNDSNSTLKIGNYNLSAGSIMTIGTTGAFDGPGLYYNTEKYRMVNKIIDDRTGRVFYTDNVYLRADITREQLDRLTFSIEENFLGARADFSPILATDWDLTRQNCVYFSRSIWNMVVGVDNLSLYIPTTLVDTPETLGNLIKTKSTYYTNFSFGDGRYCNFTHVYKDTGNKSKVELTTTGKLALLCCKITTK